MTVVTVTVTEAKQGTRVKKLGEAGVSRTVVFSLGFSFLSIWL